MQANASTPAVRQTVKLHNTEPGHNKVYIVHLVAKGDGFVVDVEWGSWPTPNRTGTKTPEPLPLAEAQLVFDRLVAQQRRGKYRVVEDGTEGVVLVGADTKEDSGLRPQLLNAIDEATLERLLADPAYVEQEKENGRRHMVDVEAGLARGINRKGEVVGLMGDLAAELIERLANTGRTCLDGEQVGDVFWVFDVTHWNGTDVRPRPYAERLAIVEVLVEGLAHVRFVPSATGAADKRQLLERLRAENAAGKVAVHEGVVFKMLSAPYTAGRPNSGGPQLKFKFYAEADVEVAPGRMGKRSVAMEVRDGTKRVPVGNVTIPSNYPMPKPGDVAVVRYLYAFDGGSLYQPQWQGVRTDKSPSECTIDQLKYAAASVGDDSDGDA
jgi:bifunctional non-homologous end joining protein LigD